MSFRDPIHILISYLKEFPTPNMLIRYARLSDSCRQLKESLKKLEKENRALKAHVAREGTYDRSNGVYLFETQGGKHVPFCAACWDTREKLVRLRRDDLGNHWCPQCSSH